MRRGQRQSRAPSRTPRSEDDRWAHGSETTLNLTLHVWRQKDRTRPGEFVTYQARGISPDMSFLEMLDVVNERLIEKGEEPIAFDHDCREGICGQCGVVINGDAARPAAGARRPASSTCGASRTATS